MNLYRLVREGGAYYDEVGGFVIAAKSGIRAREIARANAMDEGKDVWDTVQCELIGTTVIFEEDVILRDFRAG